MEINVNFLINNAITANQFLLMSLIHSEEKTLLKLYLESNQQNQIDLVELVKARFIHNSNKENELDVEKISVRTRFTEMIFGKPDDMFDELIETYPVKVIRSDGRPDYMRRDLKRCRSIYNRIINKSKKKHEHILELLTYEIAYRRRENSLMYMKILPKWLASEEWTTTEQIKGDSDQPFKQEEAGYGECFE